MLLQVQYVMFKAVRKLAVGTGAVWATAANGPLTLFVGGSAAAAERSQRTLTIIVKFDKLGKVRDLAYHTSKF